MMRRCSDRLTIWASRWRAKIGRKARVCVHDAPEIDVHQPVHLRLVDLVELAEQGDAGIVDDDVKPGMGLMSQPARSLRSAAALTRRPGVP